MAELAAHNSTDLGSIPGGSTILLGIIVYGLRSLPFKQQ